MSEYTSKQDTQKRLCEECPENAECVGLMYIECRRQAANAKMKKYRKKPIVIEAYQTDVTLDIETLEGIMHVSVGDYIIIGVNGEQYPCKPDIFEKTYEEVSDECLPSAQPERPSGKWLSHYDYCKRHGYIPSGMMAFWWCDQCEQGVDHTTKFCPHCGAKMLREDNK